MATIDKLIERFKSKPKDFKWGELLRLLSHFEYGLLPTGKTGGSSRKFLNERNGRLIMLHEPHPKAILKAYQVTDVYKHLKDEGFL